MLLYVYLLLGLVLIGPQRGIAQSTSRSVPEDNKSSRAGKDPDPHGSHPLPSVEQVLKRVRSLSSDDVDLRSAELEGQWQAGSEAVKFHLWWKQPGHFAFRAVDSADGTPLFATADGRLLIYDAAEQCALMGEPCTAGFNLKGTEKQLQFGWAFSQGSDISPHGRFLMDFHGLMTPLSDLAIESEAAGGYVLRGKTGTSTVSAGFSNIDGGQNNTFTISKSGKPVISFTRITVNEAIREQVWKIPPSDAIAKVMKVKSPSDLSESEKVRFQSVGLASLAFRSVVKDPTLQAEFEKNTGPLDWVAAAQHDKEVSSKLRSLFAEIDREEKREPSGEKAGQ